MSLALPEFGRVETGGSRRLLRGIRMAGFVALAYMLITSAVLWNDSRKADAALERSLADVSRIRTNADEARRRFLKNSDWLVALAGAESSPERILADLGALLPDGVSVSSFRVDYTGDAVARVDLSVLATSPQVYDRFLRALTRSEVFVDIKPGSENRPGPLRATISTIHRPRKAAR